MKQGPFKKWGSEILFASLLLFFLLPLASVFSPELFTFFKNLIILVVILAGINTIGRRKWIYLVPYSMGVLALLVNILHIAGVGIAESIRSFTSSLFFLFLTGTLLYKVILQKEVDLKLVLEAMSSYMLIGFSSAIVFSALFEMDPGMFVDTPKFSEGFTPFYFSFISMTTVGYGDITPTHPVSQALSVLLSIFGIFFTTIILAIIVSKFISSRQDQGSKI